MRIGIRFSPVNASGTRDLTSSPGVIVDLAAVAADVEADRFQHRGGNVDVPDLGGVADHARPVAEHRRDHVLGDRVLRSADGDVAAKRP